MPELTPLEISWFRDGTSQDDRLPPPLQSDYFVVDERSLFHHLAQMERLARSISFPVQDGGRQRSWSDLFRSDQTIVIALLMGTDIQALSERFHRALGLEPANGAALRIAFDAAATIETWRRMLMAVPGRAAVELEDRLSRAIRTRLSRPIVGLRTISDQLGADLDFSGFQSPWRTGKEDTVRDYANLPGEGGARPMSLSVCFAAFLDAMADIGKAAIPFFDESVARRNHDPAVAMLITYLRLLGSVQKRFNGFTALHRDFYYRDVLGTAPRPRSPQRVLLHLTRPPTTLPLTIEPGTLFNAVVPGRHEPLLFRSTTRVAVGNAQVAALASEYLEIDPSISPESDLGYVARVRFCERPIHGVVSNPEPWPMFGKTPRHGMPAPNPARNFGFAIASPAFHLAEGERRVGVTVQFKPMLGLEGNGALDAYVDRELSRLVEPDAALPPDHRVGELRRLFGRLFQIMMTHRRLDLRDATRQRLLARANEILDTWDRSRAVFEQLFDGGIDESVFADKLLGKAFDLALTGAEGWIDIPEVTIRPVSADDKICVRFAFALTENVPATAPYERTLHGGTLATASPVLRCVLRENATFCVYSLFDGLEISNIIIETEVLGLSNLQVSNQEALVDPSKPFLAFGSRPKVGDFVTFGGGEIARKRLTRLDAHIAWGDLPQGRGGFAAHYADYEHPYSWRDFTATTAVLRDGQWQQTSDGEIPLFDCIDGEEELAPVTHLRITDLTSWKPSDRLGAASNRHLQTRDGFVRLTLAAPPGAFGHRTHPTVYAESLAQRLRTRRGVKPRMPKDPYTPVIRSLAFDYASRTIISLDRRRSDLPRMGEAVFHLYPLGHLEIYPARRQDRVSLLPHVENAGSLFIGLRDCAGAAPLTLVFELAEETYFRSVKSSHPTKWSVLAQDGWRLLEGRRVIDDTTNGFKTSGLVTLDLPHDIDLEATSMPSGMAWLRLSANSGLQFFPGVVSVRAQAVEVEQVIDPAAETGEGLDPIPKNAMWQSRSRLPGITSIQPVGPPFAGRPAETSRNFHKRISERLRHKQRAVCPWDYERLVLAQYPNISKVKCFANLDAKAAEASYLSDHIAPRPGHVLVVVIPRPTNEPIDPCAGLMVDQLELKSIQRYLQALAPASAVVAVRNPTYDLIKVRCRVRFADRETAGAGIRRLQDDIRAYLSPWSPAGICAGFGWSIRPDQVTRHLLSLDYVERIGGLSILQLIETDSEYFLLRDTARDRDSQGETTGIRPSYPWSIALPFNGMDIEAVTDATGVAPEPTGIGHLDLGGTFVVGAGAASGHRNQVDPR